MPLKRALQTSATGAYPARPPASALPATAFQPAQIGYGVRNLLVVPFGAGADNATFNLRVLGWYLCPGGLWVPAVLCDVACTLCVAVGLAGNTDVNNNERFADTLALTANLGNAGVSAEVLSPQNDSPGHLLVDTKGCDQIELIFNLGTATGGNALIGVL